MSKDTDIQWCDSSVNPTMGCDGCELWQEKAGVKKCYAGVLHDRYGGVNKGFSPKFSILTEYPGRMAAAAKWSDLRGTKRPDKPWMDGLPRHIFVSDMSDALSAAVGFDYLKREIIDVAMSPAGARHVWMWLTKRPSRLVEFADWLGFWPSNLMAGTSITSSDTVRRVTMLLRMIQFKARLFVSAEPLWGPVHIPMDGLSLVICGGESGSGADACRVEWIRRIIADCEAASVRCFVKQLGANPYEDFNITGTPQSRRLQFKDSHGGDWSEWEPSLRVREMPEVRP